jgi:hypothetical protein
LMLCWQWQLPSKPSPPSIPITAIKNVTSGSQGQKPFFVLYVVIFKTS